MTNKIVTMRWGYQHVIELAVSSHNVTAKQPARERFLYESAAELLFIGQVAITGTTTYT